MKIKISVSFIVLFLICGIFLKYISDSRESVIQSVTDKNLESIRVANKSILDTYALVAQKSFFDIMNNYDAMDILKKFKHADEAQKKLLREKLFILLNNEYELLKKLNIRQFQFHTHDSKSLLRFHLPTLYGDSLAEIRTSVRVANSELKEMVGFEGGRNYLGYRYVFPIVYEDEHLGSVEFSISFEGIEKQLNNIFPSYTHKIMFDKETSYNKMFKEDRVFFVNSNLSDNYYLEDSVASPINKKTFEDPFVKMITIEVKKTKGFLEKLQEKENFSLPIIYKDKSYVALFLNLKNIDRESAGYIVSYAPLEEIILIKNRYDFFKLLVFVISILLFTLIVAIIIQMQKVKDEALKIEKFMDIQNSIVMLTNGVKLNFANKRFFDFFNYKSIEDFLNNHACICDLFVKSDNFFSLSDIKKGEKNWIESLSNLPGRSRVVLMLDSTKVPHAFSVSVNHYDEKYFIINFTDISDAMSEKLQLQRQALKDPLTDAYNRSYFDNNIESILALNKNQNNHSAIIFFDIDLFKKVNDTYGHAIGDDVLKNLAFIVRNNIRKDDKLVRWGGEEFIIIVGAKSIYEATYLAEQLRNCIEEYEFDTVGSITCSFGVSLHGGNDIQKSIKDADERLYKAKRGGRNRVVSN